MMMKMGKIHLRGKVELQHGGKLFWRYNNKSPKERGINLGLSQPAKVEIFAFMTRAREREEVFLSPDV